MFVIYLLLKLLLTGIVFYDLEPQRITCSTKFKWNIVIFFLNHYEIIYLVFLEQIQFEHVTLCDYVVQCFFLVQCFFFIWKFIGFFLFIYFFSMMPDLYC